MERPMYLTTLITRGTLRFEWTRITSSSVGTVLCFLPGIRHASKVQQLAVWAEIVVMLGIIGKLSGSEIGPLVFPVRQGNIGADALVLNGFDVLDGAIFRVASHLARMQLPPEAHAPQQIQHRLVVHHLRGRHQHLEDDARFASIDD